MKDIIFTCIEVKESMTGIKVIFSLERFKNKHKTGFSEGLPFGQLEMAYVNGELFKIGEEYKIDIK